MNFGLCCLFNKEPIKFKTYTFSNIKKMFDINKEETTVKIETVLENNIRSLQLAINYCSKNNIGSYRISSDIFPQMDRVKLLLGEDFFNVYLGKLENIESCGIILSMHPGQHVNMGSPNISVVESSIQDIKNHIEIASRLGCNEINIHMGGSYGDKKSSKVRFIENMRKFLTREELNFITIENDELNFSIEDVVVVCKDLGVRATYDFHHQRCFFIENRDKIKEEKLFNMARETWKNFDYQRVHLSTPREGFISKSGARPHSDYIDINDFPKWILKYENVHMDVEAKAKEESIFNLKKELNLK